MGKGREWEGKGRRGGQGLSQMPGSLAAKPKLTKSICLSTFCCLYLFLIKAERNVLVSIFMFLCMFVSNVCLCVRTIESDRVF